ncbi:MAG: metallophosphoesterase family protein [Gemmataceae bacterium]
MRIGVMSDSHGRMPAVEQALAVLLEKGVQTVIHCGDIDDASTVRLFAGWDAHFVLGNCDNDRDVLKDAIDEINATLHEPYGSLGLEGRKIGFVHGHIDFLMREMKRSGTFDFLFYGHTHKPDDYQFGPTRVINPGALHRAIPKTFISLDLATGEIERMAL